jgi:CheY-like chemotaxis protein
MARILVAEDDGDLRELVELRLRKAGHEVFAAADGKAALALVQEHGLPDVAVLDIGMPEMNGIMLLGALRRRDPEQRAIFVTAKVRPEDIATGQALGTRYITKPFAAAELIDAVTSILGEPFGKDPQSSAPVAVARPAAPIELRPPIAPLRPANQVAPAAPATSRKLTSRPPPGY